MYDEIFTHIRKFVSLSNAEEAVVGSYLQYKTLNKKDHLLKEGQVCGFNHFINKGCLRTYFVNDNGVEQIIHFGIENWWITDYTSMEEKKASQFYIQAVEKSEIILLDRKKQDELFERIPQLERYFRIILQKAYSATLMRVHYIFDQSGEERYHHFNTAFPEFIQRIPQYMLASYLGFTPEFLSKIRARKA